MKGKKEYWFCFIGPCARKTIPFGGDGPPRFAAKKAVESMGVKYDHCASGWGLSEEKMNRIQVILNEI